MLHRFQEGKLRDEDQEWHRLIPKEAQEALGKKEVRRQSVIFEIIKGEHDYVGDLELIQQVSCLRYGLDYKILKYRTLAIC